MRQTQYHLPCLIIILEILIIYLYIRSADDKYYSQAIVLRMEYDVLKGVDERVVDEKYFRKSRITQTNPEVDTDSHQDHNNYNATQSHRKEILSKVCNEMENKQYFEDVNKIYRYQAQKDITRNTQIDKLLQQFYLSKTIILPKLSLSACIPPKSGSSNWQRLLISLTKYNTSDENRLNAYKLSGEDNLYGILPRLKKNVHLHDLKKIIEMGEKIPEMAIERKYFSKRQNYTEKNIAMLNSGKYFKRRLINTRHPFSRLWSAYNSKFTKYSELKNKTSKTFKDFNHYYKFINENYETGKAEKTQDLKRHYVTFKNFLNFIIDYDQYNILGPMNIHWVPIHRYCNPCQIDYTDILRTELLAKESREFFLNIGIDVSVPSKSEVKEVSQIAKREAEKTGTDPEDPELTNIASFEVIAAFKNITKEMKYKLYEIYKYDFLLFGYSTEGFM